MNLNTRIASVDEYVRYLSQEKSERSQNRDPSADDETLAQLVQEIQRYKAKSREYALKSKILQLDLKSIEAGYQLVNNGTVDRLVKDNQRLRWRVRDLELENLKLKRLLIRKHDQTLVLQGQPAVPSPSVSPLGQSRCLDDHLACVLQREVRLPQRQTLPRLGGDHFNLTVTGMTKTKCFRPNSPQKPIPEMTQDQGPPLPPNSVRSESASDVINFMDNFPPEDDAEPIIESISPIKF